MANIAPFKALRPDPGMAKQVASKPYDVLNSDEARTEAAGNPFSFLHITKSEIDIPADVHPYSTIIYEKAKENINLLQEKKVLIREGKPCYYIYRLIMNDRSQTGLVCASSVDDYNNGTIKKHEFTRPEKEEDRINHIRITGAQTGNVFLAYNNVGEIDELISDWMLNAAPVYDFIADDRISHTIWVIENDETINRITGLFADKVPCTYIADGHHRAASAAKVKAALGKEAGPAADYFLTTLFPATQLQIMDYNRVVKDLNGLTKQEFISALRDDFMVAYSVEPVKPAVLHEFGMYLEGEWFVLHAIPNTFSDDPIGILDISILSNNVLNKILDIKDQRTDKRIDFVGGIRGLRELVRRVDNGEMKVAFSLFPVSISQLFAIADSGNVMPPKSTWFEPKLRDGLLTHLIY